MLRKIITLIPFFALPLHAQISTGYLENPVANSTESGIGLVSGWHCTAKEVTVRIDGVDLGRSGVGSIRDDATSICGQPNTGFSLLYNYNKLAPGFHTIEVFADGQLLASRQFRSVRSGGEEFLRNVEKSITINDFPSPGSSAVVTWSQAKQSFVVTSVHSAEPPPVALVGLEKLYGLVTLNYKFTNFATVFTDSAKFSSNNLTSDRSALSGVTMSGSKPIGCAKVEGSQLEFLCLIQEFSGALDTFAFNVSTGGNISGQYEYCLVGTTLSDCIEELVFTPDGTVSGLVDRSAAARFARKTFSSHSVDSSSKRSEKDENDSIGENFTSGSGEDVDRFMDAIEELLNNNSQAPH